MWRRRGGPKVIAFKKRRRKNSRRKRGHRQEFTLIRISEILVDGAKPTKGPAPKREKKPVEAAADGEAGRGKAEGQEAGGKEAGGRQIRKTSKEVINQAAFS